MCGGRRKDSGDATSIGSASKVLLRRKSIASGGASAHCFPGDRHAWPKVSAPTARAPARWRRSTAEDVRGPENNGATLDNVREAVATFEDTARIARRVLGGAHPLTLDIEDTLKHARAELAAREALSPR